MNVLPVVLDTVHTESSGDTVISMPWVNQAALPGLFDLGLRCSYLLFIHLSCTVVLCAAARTPLQKGFLISLWLWLVLKQNKSLVQHLWKIIHNDCATSNSPLGWVPFLNFDPVLHLGHCVLPLHVFLSVHPRNGSSRIDQTAVLFGWQGHLYYSRMSVLLAGALSRVRRASLRSVFCSRLVGPQLHLQPIPRLVYRLRATTTTRGLFSVCPVMFLCLR